jgi:hypothetical protein
MTRTLLTHLRSANVFTILALIAAVNGLLTWIGRGFGIHALTLQLVLGYVLYPVTFFMGVPRHEILTVSQLMATKLIANEFVGYSNLQAIMKSDNPLSVRGHTIAAYALCGFANLASLGIQMCVCRRAPCYRARADGLLQRCAERACAITRQGHRAPRAVGDDLRLHLYDADCRDRGHAPLRPQLPYRTNVYCISCVSLSCRAAVGPLLCCVAVCNKCECSSPLTCTRTMSMEPSAAAATAHSFHKIFNQARNNAKFRSGADVSESVKKIRRLILVEGIPCAIVSGSRPARPALLTGRAKGRIARCGHGYGRSYSASRTRRATCSSTTSHAGRATCARRSGTTRSGACARSRGTGAAERVLRPGRSRRTAGSRSA